MPSGKRIRVFESRVLQPLNHLRKIAATSMAKANHRTLLRQDPTEEGVVVFLACSITPQYLLNCPLPRLLIRTVCNRTDRSIRNRGKHVLDYGRKGGFKGAETPVMSESKRRAPAKNEPVHVDETALWFSTVCPACGVRYRLLFKFLDRKVRCDDCGKPFIAQDARVQTVDVQESTGLRVSEGWLIVCPACAHTELVSEERQREPFCSMCDTRLPAPVTIGKKVRKKRTLRKTRRQPPKSG